MTKFYIEAFDAENNQILGNCDGQAVLDCIQPQRTKYIKSLSSGMSRPLYGRVKYWRIVSSNGQCFDCIQNIYYGITSISDYVAKFLKGLSLTMVREIAINTIYGVYDNVYRGINLDGQQEIAKEFHNQARVILNAAYAAQFKKGETK